MPLALFRMRARTLVDVRRIRRFFNRLYIKMDIVSIEFNGKRLGTKSAVFRTLSFVETSAERALALFERVREKIRTVLT